MSYGKSTNLQKQFFYFWNYVRPTLCQRQLSNVSGIFSQLFLNSAKTFRGRKNVVTFNVFIQCDLFGSLLMLLLKSEKIGCEVKISLLRTNNFEHWEGKNELLQQGASLCQIRFLSSTVWVRKKQDEWLSVTSCNPKLPVNTQTPQLADLTKTLTSLPHMVLCFCFVGRSGCISGHLCTLLPDGH